MDTLAQSNLKTKNTSFKQKKEIENAKNSLRIYWASAGYNKK